MAKKIIIYICLFILLSGCSNKEINENVKTIIEEEKNLVVGINYPTIGYKKIDDLISTDIENIYNDFKEEYESFSSLTNKSELNIDYIYNNLDDNIITISLNIFINSSKLKNSINYIKTYNYSIKDNKIITINDIISKNEINKLPKLINEYLIDNYKEFISIDNLNKINYNYDNFSIDEDYLYIYINPNTINNDEIIDIMIPLNKLNISFNKKNPKKYNSIPVNKIIDINQKVVALTFDDGPSTYTKDIINLFKEEDVVGTFFIIGNKIDIYKDTLNEMIKNGNEIGNHSYNHKWLTKLNNDEIKEQINKTQNILKDKLNYTPTSFRPTYGGINDNIRNNIDLNIVMWDIDTMDWKYKNINTIVSRAIKNTKDLDIILFHDTKKRTYLALKKIIPILKEKGFEFVTIQELEKIKKIRNE